MYESDTQVNNVYEAIHCYTMIHRERYIVLVDVMSGSCILFLTVIYGYRGVRTKKV